MGVKIQSLERMIRWRLHFCCWISVLVDATEIYPDVAILHVRGQCPPSLFHSCDGESKLAVLRIVRVIADGGVPPRTSTRAAKPVVRHKNDEGIREINVIEVSRISPCPEGSAENPPRVTDSSESPT